MPNLLDDAHTRIFQGKALTAAHGKALADAETRRFVELNKAQKAASQYWQETLAQEARAIAISTAAQFAIDRWQEGGSIDDAMRALQEAIDATHDHTPLADLVPAVALYRLAWQYDSDKPAVIEEARAKLFAASLALYKRAKDG